MSQSPFAVIKFGSGAMSLTLPQPQLMFMYSRCSFHWNHMRRPSSKNVAIKQNLANVGRMCFPFLITCHCVRKSETRGKYDVYRNHMVLFIIVGAHNKKKTTTTQKSLHPHGMHTNKKPWQPICIPSCAVFIMICGRLEWFR